MAKLLELWAWYALSVRVLVLGATSLVGSHFVAATEGVGLVAAGRRDPRDIDILVHEFRKADLGQQEEVRILLEEADCDAVVNFVARTDVDGCEAERPEDPSSPAHPSGGHSAWSLNAELPQWLAEEAAASGRYLVHLSTDFVFDGTRGPYDESEEPDPFGPKVSWYGYTKGVGERAVRTHAPRSSAIVRISYPYRSAYPQKLDFARTLLARAKGGTLYPLYLDQVITPTWIPDVTQALPLLLTKRATGTFHIASPLATTPYAFAVTLLALAGLPTKQIRSSLLAEQPPSVRAPRPLQGGLKIGGVRLLGLEPTPFEEGIRTLLHERAAE